MAASVTVCWLMASFVFAEEAEEQKVKLRFVSYPAKASTQLFQLQTQESSTLKVNAASQYISDAYTVKSMEKWTLGLFRQRGDKEKEFVPLASCKTLKCSQQLLILGHPMDPDGDYRMTAVNCDPDHFKYGSFLFLNLTDAKLSAKVDDEELQIEPDKPAISAPEILGEGGYIQAEVSINQDGKKKKILNSRWPAHRLYRSLIIFYHGDNDRILMHTIRQPLPENTDEADGM